MAAQLLYGQFFQTPPIPTTNLSGQTIIITGANSGLGLDAAKHLSRLNCTQIILACRDLTKGEAAKSDILSSNPSSSKISVWHLDMASYASVAKFADQVATLPHVHGVVLNAGVDLVDFKSSEGLETTLAVNVVSTTLLAVLLVPVLRRSAKTLGVTPRLSIVGSAVEAFAKTEQLIAAVEGGKGIFKGLSDPSTAKMADRYFLSKLLVTLLTFHLAGLLTSSSSSQPKITLNLISPGYCRTNLFRDDSTAGSWFALRVMGRSSEEGSRTLVHGVTEAGVETHGEYVSENRVKKVSPFVRSEKGREIGQLLWSEVVDIAERIRPGCTKEI